MTWVCIPIVLDILFYLDFNLTCCDTKFHRIDSLLIIGLCRIDSTNNSRSRIATKTGLQDPSKFRVPKIDIAFLRTHTPNNIAEG